MPFVLPTNSVKALKAASNILIDVDGKMAIYDAMT